MTGRRLRRATDDPISRFGPLDVDRAAAADGGPDRRAVHRVLGHLLSLRRRVARRPATVYRAPVRAAAAGPRRRRGAPAGRPAAGSGPAATPPSPASSSPVTCCSGITPSRRSGPASRPCSATCRSSWSASSRGWSSGSGRRGTPCLRCPSSSSGVVLISGVIGAGAYGADPTLGVVLGLADRVSATRATCCSSASAAAIRGARPARSPSRRS